MNFYKTIIDRVAHYCFLLGVISGMAMTLLIFVSTLMRYIGGKPVRFSDELAGLLFISLAFFCLPHILNKGRHIRIEILLQILPKKLVMIADFFATVALVLFCAIFLYESYDFMNFSKEISSTTDISGILLWPWMAIMPFSMVLCILVQFRHGFKQPALQRHDNEDVYL
ncbi:TRAP transporter small permease [Nitrincola sp.]|uniref:TRAP transporter small permease n=1 Tax=Nitrincola sp. TaxID=1926584 RepID=UPI003A9301FD